MFLADGNHDKIMFIFLLPLYVCFGFFMGLLLLCCHENPNEEAALIIMHTCLSRQLRNINRFTILAVTVRMIYFNVINILL